MTTVLVMAVDDEPATVNMLQTMLEVMRPDWTFYGAKSGAEALRLAEERDLSLVLLDIAMPEMNGIEVCRRLRQMPKTANVPIMMLTGFDKPELREQAHDAGANAYALKPFMPGQIIRRMEQLIEEAKAAK
jgi:two-component system phosphate regulon response regulator PhoB